MELVQRLVRLVARGFYSARHILVIEAVLMHGVLSDEELASLLEIQRKEIRQLCARLRDDRLLTEYLHKEEPKEGVFQRHLTKTYYYIHYREAVDSIKWKVHSLEKRVSEDLGNDANPQGYVCPQCKSTYTALEALSNMAADGHSFICALCGADLQENKVSTEKASNQAKLGRLMDQLQIIIDVLKKIDETLVPENTFESSMKTALSAVAPDMGDAAGYDRHSNVRMASGNLASSTATLHVDIATDEEGKRAQQLAQEAAKKEQNALPQWHLESTVGVTSSSSSSGRPPPGSASSATTTAATTATSEQTGGTATPGSQEKVTADKAAEEAIAEYYAQLKAKQDQEDEEEEDEEEEEEEEDEFEDV